MSRVEWSVFLLLTPFRRRQHRCCRARKTTRTRKKLVFCRLFEGRRASARAPAPLELSALRAIVRVLSIEFSEPVPVLRSSDSRR